MTAVARHARYTIEDYVRLEEYANVKHEWLDGQVYAMAGGTPEHAAMAMSVGAALVSQLGAKRCRVYTSDARVRVQATGLDTYPDVTVVCGREERDAEDRNALVNPIVVVEVTSDSSEEYDRGDKRESYARIPSLQEIVIVSHRDRLVEVWRREGASWSRQQWGAGTSALLSSIDCALNVDELYRDPFVTPEG